jgi:hypothetical protein
VSEFSDRIKECDTAQKRANLSLKRLRELCQGFESELLGGGRSKDQKEHIRIAGEMVTLLRSDIAKIQSNRRHTQTQWIAVAGIVVTTILFVLGRCQYHANTPPPTPTPLISNTPLPTTPEPPIATPTPTQPPPSESPATSTPPGTPKKEQSPQLSPTPIKLPPPAP